MDWGAVGPLFALEDACPICRSSCSICDVHGPLWAAPLPQSRVAVVVAMRRPTEADRPADLRDELGVPKAAPIRWRGVFMSASRKARPLFCRALGISSLSRFGLGQIGADLPHREAHTAGEGRRPPYSLRSNANAAIQITIS